MTVRESSAEESGRCAAGRGYPARACLGPVSIAQITPHVFHQVIHVGATMVSGDVGVQVLPHAFNLVLVGTVGWQKMQTHATRIARQGRMHQLTVMNSVIVEHYVNHRRSGVCSPEAIE